MKIEVSENNDTFWPNFVWYCVMVILRIYFIESTPYNQTLESHMLIPAVWIYKIYAHTYINDE